MKYYFPLLTIVIVIALFSPTAGQDSLANKPEVNPASDTTHEKIHSPLFAGIASAVIPGAGQVYNKKYWKVPIVYAALGTAAYFAYYNGNVYYTVRNNIDSRVGGGDSLPRYLNLNSLFSKSTIDLNAYSTTDLQQIQDDYRGYFTLTLIVGSALYILNILDAVVDAQLYHFDVSEDLSLDLQPDILYASGGVPAPGFSLLLNLK